MTFLNPLLLVGLAAAAIPIIIHLLNLRKLKTIEFSSLHFLKELQRTKMRRVKIRQWLLLALRTLLIIGLVMAFARPALKGSLAGTIGTHATSTILILLDDSPSMAVRNERGVLFTQAKDVVTQIAGMLREGDEAYLVRLSEIGNTETFQVAHDAGAITTALADIAPSQVTASYDDALRVAGRILEDSRNFNRELHIITDGQATQFVSTVSTSDTTKLFDERVKVFLTDVAGRPRENLAITAVDVQSRILTQNKPASLLITVRNFGQTPVRNAMMSVYLDGARVVQHSLDIVAGGTASTATAVIPRRRGILHGYVQIEDDAMDIDNKRSFVLNVPGNVQVLFAGPTARDIQLPLLALTLGGDSAATGSFKPQTITESQLSSIDITKYDVLVSCGIRQFTPTVAERIAAFVRAGRGLVLFPGSESDVSNYNQVLLSLLHIPPVLPAGPLPDITVQEGYLSFGKIDLAHPLFGGLFDQPAGGKPTTPSIESPRVYTAITPDAGERGHSIITLSNGAGFLTEYPVDAGRVMIFSVEAGLQWSDFPVKGLFVPLMHRSVLYLASQNQTAATQLAGEEISLNLRLRGRSDRDAFALYSPSGIEERIVPQFLTASGTAQFTGARTTEVGVYELRRTTLQGSGGNELLDAIAVNVNPSESDLRPVTDDELAAFWASHGLQAEQIQRLDGAGKIEAAILGSRYGVELWKYFIALALLCALAEMAIGRESKERTRNASH